MGINDSIQDVMNALEGIAVTTPDGVSGYIFSGRWNNQVEREKDGTGYAYPKPACFVETKIDNGQPVGMNATAYDVTFRALLVHELINDEGTLDTANAIFPLKSKIHRVLNGFKPSYCSPLISVGVDLDHNHDNVYLCVMEWSSTFIELTGTTSDPDAGYLEQTLTNPGLNIEETVYKGVIPDGGGGTVYTTSGTIISGYGTGPTIWRDGPGDPSNSLGSNGDYYLNDTTGDVFHKEGGVYVFKLNIKGSGGDSMKNIVVSSVPITATSGNCYYIPNGVMHADSTVNVSALTHDGDSIMIMNRDQTYGLTYTGGTVYNAYGEVEATIYKNSNIWIKNINGRLEVVFG